MIFVSVFYVLNLGFLYLKIIFLIIININRVLCFAVNCLNNIKIINKIHFSLNFSLFLKNIF